MLSPYPPSFEGNPVTYGFALFSLTLVCSLSLALLLQFIFEARERRKEWRRANPARGKGPFATPLTVHRYIIAGFLITVLLGATPDVLLLYAWGEASPETIDWLFFIDRIGDGATVVPFTIACAMSAWGLQVLPTEVLKDTPVRLHRPEWATVRPQIRIAVTVMIVASLVTIAKAATGGPV